MPANDDDHGWLQRVRSDLSTALDAIDAHDEFVIAARLAEVVDMIDRRLDRVD